MANNTALLVFFYIFLYICLIGALNWGLIGTFNFNLVEFISNRKKSVQYGIYTFIGFSSLVLFILSMIVIFSTPEGYMLHEQDADIYEEYTRT